MFLSKLKSPVDESKHSVRPKADANNQNENLDTLSSLPTQIQPPPEHTQKPCQCGHHKTPLWKIHLDIATLAAIIIYAGFTYGILLQTKKSTQTASRQLEMIDRPWIKVDLKPWVDFSFQNGNASWGVELITTNVGHSVASAIYPRARLLALPIGDVIDGPRNAAEQLCAEVARLFESVRKYPVVWEDSIFPQGGPITYPQNIIVIPSEIEKQSFDGGPKVGRGVTLAVVGCVEYHYASSDKPHRTGVAYLLSHNEDPAIPEAARVFFSIGGKTISKDKMQLTEVTTFAN